MTGPGAAWNDVPAWVRRNRDGLPQPGTAGERAGEAYRVEAGRPAGSVARQCLDVPHAAHEGCAGIPEPGPAGRPRQRGVQRDRRTVTMDGPVVERVEQLAEQQYGGNYSAALQAVAEAGLAALDATTRMAAAEAELDRLTGGPA